MTVPPPGRTTEGNSPTARPHRRASRWLPGATLVLALLAVAAGGWFLTDRSTPRTREVVHHVPAASRSDLSSVDCPVTTSCPLTIPATAAVRATTIAAARRYFPAAKVVDRWALVDADGHLIGEYLTMTTSGQVDVQVVSRCVAGGAAVPGTPMGTPPSTMSPRTGATASVVVSGRAGCGVAVIVDTLIGQTLPRAAADALAHDPALPLP